METSLFWPTALYILLCLMMAGYTLMDGYDLGVGMLLPFFRNPRERERLLASLSPFWDGNEVWLIISGGLMFVAFPPVYAGMLAGFYLPAMAVLFAVIVRAASFEFWFHSEKHKRAWGVAFSLSSLIIPVLLALMAGYAVAGVLLTPDQRVLLSHRVLLNYFPASLAVTTVAAMLFQGLAFTTGFAGEDFHLKVLKTGKVLWWVYLAAMLGLIAAGYQALPHARSQGLVWAGLVLALLALLAAGWLLIKDRLKYLFLCSSLVFGALWISLAGAQFPNLVRSAVYGVDGLTISNSASPVPVLRIMAVVTIVGMAVVLLYTWYIHRIFRSGPTEGGY